MKKSENLSISTYVEWWRELVKDKGESDIWGRRYTCLFEMLLKLTYDGVSEFEIMCLKKYHSIDFFLSQVQNLSEGVRKEELLEYLKTFPGIDIRKTNQLGMTQGCYDFVFMFVDSQIENLNHKETIIKTYNQKKLLNKIVPNEGKISPIIKI